MVKKTKEVPQAQPPSLVKEKLKDLDEVEVATIGEMLVKDVLIAEIAKTMNCSEKVVLQIRRELRKRGIEIKRQVMSKTKALFDKVAEGLK